MKDRLPKYIKVNSELKNQTNRINWKCSKNKPVKKAKEIR